MSAITHPVRTAGLLFLPLVCHCCVVSECVIVKYPRKTAKEALDKLFLKLFRCNCEVLNIIII